MITNDGSFCHSGAKNWFKMTKKWFKMTKNWFKMTEKEF